MKRLDISLLIGLVLIVLGGLFLLETLDVVRGVLPLLFVLLFVASGIVFLYFFWINREHWWALIPGFSLVGLGALIGLSEYGPEELATLAAAIFMASIGLSFLAVYLVKREHWWSIIPGGVLVSVAVLLGIENVFPNGDIAASIFLLGLATTFGVVAIIPTPTGRMKWAWIPAGILFVISLIVFSAAVSGFQYVWPIGIIAVGLWILYRAMFRGGKTQKKLEEQLGTEIESGETKDISPQN